MDTRPTPSGEFHKSSLMSCQTNVGPVLSRHVASPGYNKLTIEFCIPVEVSYVMKC